jgi:hypothetical protein
MLTVISVSKHTSLGSWGALELVGAGALLRLNWTGDLELPASVAEELTGGGLLLNQEQGRLLLLPYASQSVVSYDLKEGRELHEPVVLRRNPDRGLRMATALVVPSHGVALLTESTLSLFREDCSVTWVREDDFQGWIIKGSTPHELLLVASDWTGQESRQSRSLDDGRRLD